MIDVHLHTRFSFDSEEEPQNYIKRASELGIPVVGFSEHYDYDAHLDGEDVALADLDAYCANVDKLRREFAGVEILCGVEFGYRAEAVEKYSGLVARYPFDYVINSLHTLPLRGDCYHDAFFAGKPLEQSYIDYFKGVLESVKADYDFQIIGHLGYVSRYRTGKGAKISLSDYRDISDEILREIIKRDKCLEINSSCGKSGSCFLPDKDYILRYLELGGKLLSFGSDAHRAADYMKKATELKDFLHSVGVNELYFYRKRVPVGYKI